MSGIDKYIEDHINNYINAVIEVIKNNTYSLVNNDIRSLVVKPPLDSMDIIKVKMLSLAKREKIILDSDKIENTLAKFRELLENELYFIMDLRDGFLIEKVKGFSPKKDNEVIKILKKDLDVVNKDIKKKVKISLNSCINNYLLKEIVEVNNNVSEVKEDFINSFSKFMKTTYIKQFNENLSIKLMVKDRILLNSISEQADRYLFTKKNSHIFDEIKEWITFFFFVNYLEIFTKGIFMNKYYNIISNYV